MIKNHNDILTVSQIDNTKQTVSIKVVDRLYLIHTNGFRFTFPGFVANVLLSTVYMFSFFIILKNFC